MLFTLQRYEFLSKSQRPYGCRWCRQDVVYLTYGTGYRSVSYPFFSGYERDEAFPQDTDLSPVPLFRGTAKYF